MKILKYPKEKVYWKENVFKCEVCKAIFEVGQEDYIAMEGYNPKTDKERQLYWGFECSFCYRVNFVNWIENVS